MRPVRDAPSAGGTRPAVRSFRHRTGDGAATSVHVAEYPLPGWEPRVVVLDPPCCLTAWCGAGGVAEALVGGFYVRPHGRPLGELWIGGRRMASEPFASPWHARRGCLSLEGGTVALAARPELPSAPKGDLLQAGPLLVAGGAALVRDGEDPEGFSAGAAQFDSDITAGRYPRAAIGRAGDTVLAVACDGRAHDDAGLTLAELAQLMLALGADTALNLDGGGSTSLVSGGELLNRPREQHGIELVAGRPISTAIAFLPRS